MAVLSHLRSWWQRWTGEEETPLDGDFPAWAFSLLLHFGLLVWISVWTFAAPHPLELTLTSMPNSLTGDDPDEFRFQEQEMPDIGSASLGGVSVALASAPDLDDISEIVKPSEVDPLESGDIQFTQGIELAVAPLEASTKLVHGRAGVGVTGADGAIDRITHEILLSLDERDTLVVWLFDRSGSLQRQRSRIRARLQRIYEELGLIDKPFHDHSNRPLLTAVMAFGQRHTWLLEKPTANVQAIQDAVASIELDESGIENVFTAIYAAAERFHKLRSKRNVMLIAVTDEVGNDQYSMLERTVHICRRYAMPVYVLGVPAAFGQATSMLKWVDPNPNYDQTPRWGEVNQGPESLWLERLQLPFAGGRYETIDAGFGPFSLSRLCYQTGGIYFAIHPNRDTKRRIARGETEAFSTYMSHFFDPQRMRPYRPDYVSIAEHMRNVKANAARQAVVQASAMTIQRMRGPTLTFIKRDEAQFAANLTEAQKMAAKLEPKLAAVYETLKRGEEDRAREETLRWQADYDLAMGQALAVLVRTRTYNEMLAKAKRGIEAQQETSNTWRLIPDGEITVNSRLARDADKARDYLQRVVKDHPGTPWAMLAQSELKIPMGWRWDESYTAPAGDDRSGRQPNNNNNPRPPQDDQKRMLSKAPPRRDVPKL